MHDQVLEETKNRDIDDVIALTRAAVASCDVALQDYSAEEEKLLTAIAHAKKDLEAKSHKTEELMLVEMASLEKFKVSRMTRAQASKAVEEAQSSRDDVAKHMLILDLELQNRSKIADMELARLEVETAAASAKEAMAMWKVKEREAMTASRTIAKEHQLKTALAFRERRERAEENRREDEEVSKVTLQRELAELKDIEKMREQRERARQQALKRQLAPRRLALTENDSAAKVARVVHDAD
eukprot:TRINITY_DN19523_c0_g1_i1.p1 TRINITY_DN19523_c0_g1~~TRINITY_DN19523_c0_g1_i1.p1  ORF type:complete len:241 (-),score=77.31 TRINITY_DN19523_c0_g1_i1:212-934(-)